MKRLIYGLSLIATALLTSLSQPAAVFADSTNFITKIPSVDDKFLGTTSTLIVSEKNVDFAGSVLNQMFRLSLSDGIKWNYPAHGEFSGLNHEGNTVTTATYKKVSNKILEIQLAAGAGEANEVEIPMNVNIDGAKGDAKVTIDGMDSMITSGDYIFAQVGSNNTVATVEKVDTISGSQDEINVIRIDESFIGAIKDLDEQKIIFKLPSNFEWIKGGTSTFTGGLSYLGSINITANQLEGRTMTIKLTADRQVEHRGSIYLHGLRVKPKQGAKYGDVKVTIEGDNITSEDLVVARYADYGITVSTDQEIPKLYAGRDGSDKKDTELAVLHLKENVVNSIIPARKTKVEFPSWIKILEVKIEDAKGIDVASFQKALDAAVLADDHKPDDQQYNIEFEIVPDGSGKKVEFGLQFYSKIKAGKSGDIGATISGRQGAEGKVVLGKAVNPLELSGTTKSIVIGKKDQKVGDIVIKEVAEGLIGEKEGLVITLPDEFKWNEKGKVEVIQGDLILDSENIKVNGVNMTIPIKAESSKPSTVKLTGSSINVDRTVPVMDIGVSVKIGKSKSGEVNVGKIVTPAPSQVSFQAIFTIDSATYTINGVEKVADIAPYLKNGRSYMPIRYAAEALGLTDSNIIWDPKARAVTLIRNDRIAQMQIGSRSILINGVIVEMDAAAEIKDGRATLPLRFAAQALGAHVEWDQAIQTVKISN